MDDRRGEDGATYRTAPGASELPPIGITDGGATLRRNLVGAHELRGGSQLFQGAKIAVAQHEIEKLGGAAHKPRRLDG